MKILKYGLMGITGGFFFTMLYNIIWGHIDLSEPMEKWIVYLPGSGSVYLQWFIFAIVFAALKQLAFKLRMENNSRFALNMIIGAISGFLLILEDIALSYYNGFRHFQLPVEQAMLVYSNWLYSCCFITLLGLVAGFVVGLFEVEKAGNTQCPSCKAKISHGADRCEHCNALLVKTKTDIKTRSALNKPTTLSQGISGKQIFKKRLKIGIALVVSIAILTLFYDYLCERDIFFEPKAIKVVKNGYLSNDINYEAFHDYTIEVLINNFFLEPKWRYRYYDKPYVFVKGKVNFEGENKAVLRFALSEDRSSFKVEGLYFNNDCEFGESKSTEFEFIDHMYRSKSNSDPQKAGHHTLGGQGGD